MTTFAHFIEHMFFKGGKEISGEKIASTVESLGGDINAFTSFDYTCYHITLPKEHIKKSIEILLKMTSAPLFRPSDIEMEKGVVLEEYKRSLDNPSQYNFFELQKSVFPKGYSHPILGSKKTVSNFNKQKILDFKKKYYHLGNSFLVVACDWESISRKQKIKSLIESFKFSKGKKHEKLKRIFLSKGQNGQQFSQFSHFLQFWRLAILVNFHNTINFI